MGLSDVGLSVEEARFQDRLEIQVRNAIEVILDKNRQYGGSWKSRGGVGAFMMFARKWDRIENALTIRNERGDNIGYRDLFELAKVDNRQEGIIDDLEDLRNYLILAIDEINKRKVELTAGPRPKDPESFI